MKSDNKSQKDKFIETAARALSCDESEEAFAKKLKAVTSAKIVAQEPVKKKAKPKKK